MAGPKPRGDAALGRRAGGVSRLSRSRAQAPRKAVKRARHDATFIEREIVELDEECARFRRLCRRFKDARRAGRDVGDILAELGPSVLHLHVHTRGLDRMIDTLE